MIARVYGRWMLSANTEAGGKEAKFAGLAPSQEGAQRPDGLSLSRHSGAKTAQFDSVKNLNACF